MPKNDLTLKECYNSLKKGDVSKIAKNANVSRQAVWQVANGVFKNELIAKSIILLGKMRKQEQENKLNQLKVAI
jgi:hypothetical protein